MDEPIEEAFFNWLYSKVAAVEVPTPSLSYYTLLNAMQHTEFVWVLAGDDNRAQDGLDLRREFLKAAFLKEDPPWMMTPCSVLEMLIAFSRRAEWDTSISAREWFWKFLENLGLSDFNDATNRVTERTLEILDRFVWRTYDHNGRGGLFPMKYPHQDQRHVELWYQFAEYLVEQEELNV